jgi:hypothetical protein
VVTDVASLHFDDEEGVDLVILDGKVLSIVEGEINRMTPR